MIFIFLATLVVANTTGLMPEGDDVECRDEPDGKQCPPLCPTCTCVSHSLQTAPLAFIAFTTVDLTIATIELPPPADVRGQLAKPPATRPPIV